MARSNRSTRRLAGVAAAVTAATMLLAACAQEGGNGGSSSSAAPSGSDTASSAPAGAALTVGTTDKVTTLDPAGSYDNGSFMVMNQVFPFVMNSKLGTADVEGDIAESASFTSPNEYTVKLKSGLKFANGHDLTSSDVKFSFDRILTINDPNGPAALLGNLEKVDAPDDTTVVFTLKNANDQTWPQVLSSPAGPIVDEESFSADAVTPDADIVKANAFAGQYTIDSYAFNELISFKPNADYKGLLDPAKGEVSMKYYADASNMKLDIQQGAIDVAYRSLSPADIADLKTDSKVKVVDGPGGEIRYIVFNFDTMPFGAKTAEADGAKALAVRTAMANLLDRAALAKDVYQDTYTPLYSFVPQGMTGATEVLKEMYGDGQGGPSADKAKAALEAAGVTTPVTLNLQYSNDHYGPSSADEYARIKDQLEKGGLFTVNLATTEWVTYAKDRTADAYPLYQLGWFPDYSDADNYLTPFFGTENFLQNHYSNPKMDELISQQQVEGDAAKRTALIEEAQQVEAADLSTLPYLQGAQFAVTGADVSGAQLDGSFKFRLGSLSKG